MIKRIVDELKTLPAVPADATARVLARVDAARRGEEPAYASDDDDVIFFPTSTEEMPAPSPSRGEPWAATAPAPGSRSAHGWRRRFIFSLPAAIGYALAATLAGFLIRGAVPRPPATDGIASVPAPESSTATGRIVPAAASARALQETPVAVQFVLDARRAKSVAVVGDFNGWDGSATPLERDSASGVWTALVKVPPGRHVYAFLVDGTVWTLDPNAPRAKDSDYGTEQSVVIVGLR
jgi:hypothetical protein